MAQAKQERVPPLRKFYQIIDHGDAASKAAALPEFPRILELEITNHCNFHCLMCKTGTGTCKRERGYMRWEVYEKLLEEAQGREIAFKFVGQGEPTLHPEALKMVRAAAERGITCHMTTNGSLLTEANMEEWITSGLASIKFSFQGVDAAGYRELRLKDDFEELYHRIARFWQLRGDRAFPFISVCTSITDETPEQVQAFREKFAPVCDQVEVGFTTLEFIDASKIENVQSREKFLQIQQRQMLNKVRYPCCNQVFDILAVHWNGDVTACCADTNDEMVLGNLNEHSLAYFWICEREQEFRTILGQGKYDDLPLCRHCYDFMGYMHKQSQAEGEAGA